LIGPGILR